MPRLLTLLLLCTSALAQTPAPAPPSSPSAAQEVDPVPGSPEMNPDQRKRFAEAGRIFNTSRFAEALALLRPLRQELPDDVNVAKFTAEAAINTGDPALAINTLKPFELREPDDWQTVSILAHAFAQAGQKQLRDTEVARLQTLHDTLGPPFNSRRDYLLETVPAGDKTIRFFPALTPWGPYKVHLMARVYNAAGDQLLRITLESSDADQSLFAQQHPADAAKGLRQFSLDGYAPDQRNAAGQVVQTHFTYAFFAGQPPYDLVRERAIAIAEGKVKPLSSRTGTVQR